MASARRTKAPPALATFGVDVMTHQFRVESKHFLDVGGVRIERLDQRLPRQDVGLVECIEMMHHALAHPPLGIAQAYDRPGLDLHARNPARIGDGVSLSHYGSPQR